MKIKNLKRNASSKTISVEIERAPLDVATVCGNQYPMEEWADMMGDWEAETAQAQDEMEKESITWGGEL